MPSDGSLQMKAPIADRWTLVRGNEMRMLSASEALAAMSFPADTKRIIEAVMTAA